MLYPMLAGLLLSQDVPLREQPHRVQAIGAYLNYPTTDDELREIVRTGKRKNYRDGESEGITTATNRLRQTFVNVEKNAEHPLDAAAFLREVAWEIERDYNEPANEGLRYTPFFVLHVVIDLYDGIASIYLKDNKHDDKQ